MSETGRAGINRALSWLKKSLEITEKTVAPDSLLPNVRPTIDTFGWERLVEEQVDTAQAAQPAVAVASSTPAVNVLRYVLQASLEHGDVATHQMALLKRRNPGALDVGLPTDRVTLDAGEFMSLIGHTFLIENDFIIGEMITAPTVGSITLRVRFIDLPIGEYIPPL